MLCKVENSNAVLIAAVESVSCVEAGTSSANDHSLELSIFRIIKVEFGKSVVDVGFEGESSPVEKTANNCHFLHLFSDRSWLKKHLDYCFCHQGVLVYHPASALNHH